MTAGRHVDDARPVDNGEPDAEQPGTEQPDVEQPGTEQTGTEQPDAEQPHAHLDDTPVLPSRSSDDLDTGWGDRPRGDDDERLLRDVPPHWGR